MNNINIAHIKQNDTEYKIQTVEEHLNNVSSLCGMFTDKLGLGKNVGEFLGLLHDIGKYRDNFQKYIRLESKYDSTGLSLNEDKSHALTSAIVMKQIIKNKVLSLFLFNIIAGHHRGLYDYSLKSTSSTLHSLINEELPKDYNNVFNTIIDLVNDRDFVQFISNNIEYINHIIRILFSCVVDADYRDTDEFMSSIDYKKHNVSVYSKIYDCYYKYITHFNTDNYINKLRTDIRESCCESGKNRNENICLLDAPVGSGKSVSSLGFAVNRMKYHNKKRIIIVVPFISILEQTSRILHEIFDESCCSIIEDYSCVNYDGLSERELVDAMRLESNWDADIVITTHVNFFESIYSNSPSRCRKLHNIADSVVIIDETQKIPLDFLQPIINGIECYRKLFNVDFLMMSGTQLKLINDDSGKIDCGGRVLYGFNNAYHIIKDTDKIFNEFKRMKFIELYEQQSYLSIAEKMLEHNNSLCFVNTRDESKSVYRNLKSICKESDNIICVSKDMSSKHVADKIDEIRRNLSEGNHVYVVATSLMEAGVDVDFEVIYTTGCGADDINQRAGRGNRNGNKDYGCCYIFEFYSDDEKKRQSYIVNKNNARERVKNELNTKQLEYDNPNVIEKYFKYIYSSRNSKNSFDSKEIANLLYPVISKSYELQFETAADRFKLIDDEDMISVIVPYNMTVNEMLNKEFSEIVKNVVSISKWRFNIIKERGLISELKKGVYYINNDYIYTDEVGLDENIDMIV